MPLQFDVVSDEEMLLVFRNIIYEGHKDNTYKFAFARFLLEYCSDHDPAETRVGFSCIARYFFKYYWPQACRADIRHSSHRRKPEIISILEEEFGGHGREETYGEIRHLRPEKVRRCLDGIRNTVFHNVTWRFQKVKFKSAVEARVFFDYKIDRHINDNRKTVNLDYGINLNPRAMEFLRKNNAVLLKEVIHEWSRFLVKMNIHVRIIPAREDNRVQTNMSPKYGWITSPFSGTCMHCGDPLNDWTETHVDHARYLDDSPRGDMWGISLACQVCHLKRRNMLPLGYPGRDVLDG